MCLWRRAPEAAFRSLPGLEEAIRTAADALEARISRLETAPLPEAGSGPPAGGLVLRRRSLRLFWTLLAFLAGGCFAAGYWIARAG